MTGYGNGTAERDGNSGIPTEASASSSEHALPSSRSMVETTATILVNWAALSDEGAWVTTHIAWPMSSGLSIVEVAGRLGETKAWVTGRLEELQRELVRLAVAPPVDGSETTPRPHQQRI